MIDIQTETVVPFLKPPSTFRQTIGANTLEVGSERHAHRQT